MDKVTRPFCWHQNFVQKGLSTPAPGLYIHVEKHEKMCINRNSKRFFATNCRNVKSFLLTSKFWPQGFVCPSPGAIYMYKIIKKCVWNQTSKRLFWNLQHMGKKKRPFCRHKIFVLNGLSAPAWGYIHLKKTHIQNSKKSDFKEIFFKLVTNGQRDKEFLLT